MKSFQLDWGWDLDHHVRDAKKELKGMNATAVRDLISERLKAAQGIKDVGEYRKRYWHFKATLLAAFETQVDEFFSDPHNNLQEAITSTLQGVVVDQEELENMLASTDPFKHQLALEQSVKGLSRAVCFLLMERAMATPPVPSAEN